MNSLARLVPGLLVHVLRGLESMVSRSHGENKSFVAASFTEAVPTGVRNESQRLVGIPVSTEQQGKSKPGQDKITMTTVWGKKVFALRRNSYNLNNVARFFFYFI